MKKLIIGVLAHVDAGKTTLSESLLYVSGKTRKLGRVDNKDAYLDNDELEKARGITIFSKQALFEVDDTQITLLDTPGHVDFSTEMERTLQVLDYAILVISGADGVQGHTKTLWRLLTHYRIPVFLFINKMDQMGTDKEQLLSELKKQLADSCIVCGQGQDEDFYEQVAMCDEILLEEYLETGQIGISQIRVALRARKFFPCFFGSALKLQGIEAFMQGLVNYTEMPLFPETFGAKIFKIGRDEQGNRLTYMKITGGRLKVRDVVTNGVWQEKITQIRIYSGEKFVAVSEADAGVVCAVTGLTQTKPGEALGDETDLHAPVLEPVLTYRILLPADCDPRVMMPKLRQLEEEEPQLQLVWDEQLEEIRLKVMGEVQTEILQSVIQSRFGISVTFDTGQIVYKETIANVVEGVGHFEPLGHYAEVHLLLEPGERGSGLQFAEDCREAVLGKSWKKLILSHLKEKDHKGVLTGSAITDLKITLVSGRAHNKHTAGGDFREATYRAVRQGLKVAESILLEPYYSYQLELPEKMVGRAMTDIEKMHGTCQISQLVGDIASITGKAPVVNMRNYQQDVMAYSNGQGRLFCSLLGYEPCHNSGEVIAMWGYKSEEDVENPTGSIFCEKGTSFLIEWDQVEDYMHVESRLQKKETPWEETVGKEASLSGKSRIDPEEIERIFQQTYYANQGRKSVWQKKSTMNVGHDRSTTHLSKHKDSKEEYLLVDGYNIIFAWPELKDLAEDNLDGARIKLLDVLSKYQSVRKCQIIVVFDAYRVQRQHEEIIDYDNIHMVFTREAQTADHYIEKFSHDNQEKYQITVATSDGLEQLIIRGAGCAILSARELKEEIERTNADVMQAYQEKQRIDPNHLQDALSAESKEQIEKLFSEEKDK
ncbi:MAG: TetM/TetW/TetO/TetS family tetracycline resistance ribosomal protection protein [Firmicutes bacterium]|nr:TetM/TetW/TetO/TetS family tetracycline resistance ribosomal protection protein [Bacillota bacterium]